MFRFFCSVVLWGGRGTANKYHWPMWGALAVFRPHWVCPCLRHVCFPRLHCSGSRLLYRERALSCLHFPGLSCSGSGFPVLRKEADSWACVLCLPRPSSSGSQELDECTLPGAVHLIPSAVPASVSLRQFGAPCVSSGELVSSCDPPGGCQPLRISGSLSLETGSLFAVW